MRTFETPEIEITKFHVEDVITTSGDTVDDRNTLDESDIGIWA